MKSEKQLAYEALLAKQKKEIDAWKANQEEELRTYREEQRVLDIMIDNTFNNILGLFKEFVKEQDAVREEEYYETPQDRADDVYTSFRHWLEKKL